MAFAPFSFAQIFRSSAVRGSLYWKNRKPDAAYWQQDVHYTIGARINEEEHRIDGTETLVYTNNSPDTLGVVYFHLYQNAFVRGSYLHKLEEEKGQKPIMGKHEAAGEGTIIEHIEVDGKHAMVVLDNTVMQVTLPKPLKPGEKISITMGFKTWYDRGSTRRRMAMYDAWGSMHYNGVQWYPKMCVYDRKFGWDTYQHLNKEFYGDFGTFDVSLDFPSNYVVEATGELSNRSMVLPNALRKQLDIKNFATKKWGEKPSIITPYIKGERKVWKYHAEGVHDFAFTADPSYRIGSTTWNGIECVAIAQEPHASGWQNGAEYVAKIIKTFSEDIGPYGYPKMVAADAADGMEYPMLTLDGGSDPGYHGLLVHEIGHNWFYGMVGSNETYRAALDEGFTQFLTSWGLRRIDGDTMVSTPSENKWVRKHSEPVNTMDRNVLNAYSADALSRNELPLNTHSNDFHDALGHEGGYRQVYFKTASMLYNLQYVLGDSLFQQALHHYFMQWRFAHPYFEDFRASIIQFTHVDLNWFFDEWIETTKTIDYGIKSVSKRNSADMWNITFERKGEMQMPVDFTVTAKDGTRKSYTISNTWFQKKGNTEPIDGKWWGWGKIQPTYTAHVTVPGGIKYVQIDTSYRLADVDLTNNYYSRGFFAKNPGVIMKFDAGLNGPTDRRHYRSYWRPDIWYNGVDGVKAGLHIEGDYMGVLDKVDATVWWNTHLLQQEEYQPASGEGWYKRYRPISYSINLSSPFSKKLPKLTGDLHMRDLDGLKYVRAGVGYATSDHSNVSLHLLDMMRRDASDLDYLLDPREWSSTKNRPNSSLNLAFNSSYSYGKGAGVVRLLLRAPFLAGNESNAFDYSFAQAEMTNVHRLGKLYLRTRLFARYGMGNTIPYESALFAGGANPEGLMEDKYTRSVGFVPNDWRGVSRYEPTHFQMGGGLNLRGYSGYFLPDERDGTLLIGYKGRSGAAVNMELDFDRLINLSPKITRSWLSVDAYLFADAGIIELSRYSVPDFVTTMPTEMWSDVHVDAGPGVAFTIKKFGPFEKARPLTIRVDFPVYLNRTPFNNPQYGAFRYVVGVNRTF
jgi:aminopeptidase N